MFVKTPLYFLKNTFWKNGEEKGLLKNYNEQAKRKKKKTFLYMKVATNKLALLDLNKGGRKEIRRKHLMLQARFSHMGKLM